MESQPSQKKIRPGIVCVDHSLQGPEAQRHREEVDDIKQILMQQGYTPVEVDARNIDAIKEQLRPITENRQKIQILCGHSPRGPEIYQQDIRELASGIAERGHVLLTPGSDSGLMKIIADEALKKGGDVIGISSTHVGGTKFEPVHPGMSAVIIAPSEDERTAWYGRLADHLVVGPGGIGSVADGTKEIYTRYIDDMYRAATKDEPFKPLTYLSTPSHEYPDGHYGAFMDMIGRTIQSGMSPAQIRLFVTEAHTPAQVFESIKHFESEGARQERKALLHQYRLAPGEKLDYRAYPAAADKRSPVKPSMEHEFRGWVNSQGGLGPESNRLVVDLNAPPEELKSVMKIIESRVKPVRVRDVPASNILELNPLSMKRIQGSLWMDGRLDKTGKRSIESGPVLYMPIQDKQKAGEYANISTDPYFGLLAYVEPVPPPVKVKFGDMKDKAKFTPIARDMGYYSPSN